MRRRALVGLGVVATIVAILLGTEIRLNRREPKCGYGTPPPEQAAMLSKLGRVPTPSLQWCSAPML